jgi:hypothetical protein
MAARMFNGRSGWDADLPERCEIREFGSTRRLSRLLNYYELQNPSCSARVAALPRLSLADHDKPVRPPMRAVRALYRRSSSLCQRR